MEIGGRLRTIREMKKLSQGDIEKRTGLLRCYVSRVENGHTVPAVETLEKFARALEVSLYELFYDGNKPPELPTLPRQVTSDMVTLWVRKKDAPFANKLLRILRQVADPDRQLLMFIARRMARSSR